MFFDYTVEIIELRKDNELYLCAYKTFSSYKKAIDFIDCAIDKIKNYPHDITIYKQNEYSIPEIVFSMRTNKHTSFHKVDLYLN